MGRTKEQLEKFHFRGFEWDDIRRILVRGRNGCRSKFSEREELEASLDVVFDGQPNRLDLTEAEAIAMMEDVSEYPHELQFRIGQRIDELQAACSSDGGVAIEPHDREEVLKMLKKLDQKLESIDALPLGPGVSCGTGPVFYQRLFAFEAYIEIAKKLGRVPFRAEIEAVQTGECKGRALSRAVERMGLRMADVPPQTECPN